MCKKCICRNDCEGQLSRNQRSQGEPWIPCRFSISEEEREGRKLIGRDIDYNTVPKKVHPDRRGFLEPKSPIGGVSCLTGMELHSSSLVEEAFGKGDHINQLRSVAGGLKDIFSWQPQMLSNVQWKKFLKLVSPIS